MYFFLLLRAHGEGCGGPCGRERAEAAASGRRRRAGGGMRVGPPPPRPPLACHFGRSFDTRRGVAAGGGSAAPRGCVSGAALGVLGGGHRGGAAASPGGAERGRPGAGGAGFGRGPWGRSRWRLGAAAAGGREPRRAAPAAPSARVAFVPGAHGESERAREVQVRETEAVGKEAGPLCFPARLRRTDWLNVAEARLAGAAVCVCVGVCVE